MTSVAPGKGACGPERRVPVFDPVLRAKNYRDASGVVFVRRGVWQAFFMQEPGDCGGRDAAGFKGNAQAVFIHDERAAKRERADRRCVWVGCGIGGKRPVEEGKGRKIRQVGYDELDWRWNRFSRRRGVAGLKDDGRRKKVEYEERFEEKV